MSDINGYMADAERDEMSEASQVVNRRRCRGDAHFIEFTLMHLSPGAVKWDSREMREKMEREGLATQTWKITCQCGAVLVGWYSPSIQLAKMEAEKPSAVSSLVEKEPAARRVQLD
jgi:hypothetical protein